MIQRSPNLIALSICLYFVVLAIVYAAITPAFEAPDEGAHFLYIHNMLEEHRLPLLESRERVFASHSTQRHQPPLYYLIGAVLVAGTKRNDVNAHLQVNPFAAIGTVSPNNQNVYLHPLHYAGDTATAVWILRLYSIALATLTLWLAYLTGRLAFQRASTGLLAMLIVASIPGFIFIGASINNDNLVTFVYAAGIYWCLRLWHRQAITWKDIAAISLILSAAALSKLTGLALFGLVYLAVIVGTFRRRYPSRQAALLIVASLLASGVLAGWWYVRNLNLYGDPLAMQATVAIWGRGGMPISADEIKGIWESVWMILGHFNIRGPEWFYIYIVVITVAGIAGLVLVWQRYPAQRLPSAFLLLTCFVVVTALAAATRQINVSQGRILYPALVAFAPLLAAGWQSLLGRRVGGLLVVPLTTMALASSAIYLRTAYAPLEVVQTLPQNAQVLNIQAETLTISGYQLTSDALNPGGLLRLKVCFSGRHVENPNLFVKALNPVTEIPVGSADVYPGMSPTNDLVSTGPIYCAPVVLRLASTQQPLPVQLKLQIGWNVPGHFVPLKDTNGQPIGSLIVSGTTLIDPQQKANAAVSTNVTYGDSIALTGYTLSPVSPGGTAEITLRWRDLSHMTNNYTTAVSLLDSSNKVVAQADGEVAGYPTSAWRPGPDFTDTRKLAIPMGLSPGTYTLYVGWYDPVNGSRLSAHGDGVNSALNFFEVRVEIKP